METQQVPRWVLRLKPCDLNTENDTVEKTEVDNFLTLQVKRRVPQQ